MSIRKKLELAEKESLSPYAQLSKDSKGRNSPEEKCSLRTEYQRDRDRIIHSKAFRRLKHKTQVFIAPEGDHYRTRLTHTLEVTQIARTIARALKLNEDLTEAIALGHDLGHTPFGHSGEYILDKLNPKGFRHNIQSFRVVDFLESDSGKGLNLTYEVKDGILNHSSSKSPSTLEGWIVKFADRIAYINHDIDDAIRAGIISIDDFKFNREFLGLRSSQRIEYMILDIVEYSQGKGQVKMSEKGDKLLNEIREELFNILYLNKKVKGEEDKVNYIITEIYNYYLKNIDQLPEKYLKLKKEYSLDKDTIVTDYISGMTDRYILNLFENLFIPKTWNKL